MEIRRSNPDQAYNIEISFTEIYKENVYDLLQSNDGPREEWTPAQVLEVPKL